MRKNVKSLDTVHIRTHTGNLINNEKKIFRMDIGTNASNFGVQLKKENDNNLGCPKDANPLQIPTQRYLKIKGYNTNECLNRKNEKFKSNVVGVGVSKGITDLYSHVRSNNSEMLDDPLIKQKYTKKTLSNNPTSNFKFPTSNTAITLIALIITIIVLLILAGVTINMVMGENGIIEKARMAKMETNKAQEDENNKLLDLENKLEINTTREENTSQSKRKILFDSEKDSNGPITVAGATDGSSERNFSDNVNNYDNILLYVESSADSSQIFPPTIIDKSDFNKNVIYYMGGYSSTCNLASGFVNIDSINNKIVYINKGHSYHLITKVIGIKY